MLNSVQHSDRLSNVKSDFIFTAAQTTRRTPVSAHGIAQGLRQFFEFLHHLGALFRRVSGF